MKALLEFNLPEDSDSHELALKGPHYRYVIDETFSFLRRKGKYSDSLTAKEYRLLEEIRQFIVDTLNEV